MEERESLITEIYAVKSRDESKIIALLDFSEYRPFGARIKVVVFSYDSSSKIAQWSIETLMKEFKRELTEIHEFEFCDKPILKTVFGNFRFPGP